MKKFKVMIYHHIRLTIFFILFTLVAGCKSKNTVDHPLELNTLATVSGFKNEGNEEKHIFQICLKRSDLKVVVDGVNLPTGFGLESSAYLSGTSAHAVLIAELAITTAEVNPILEKALDLGLTVTSLHNSFLTDQPRMMSLHLSGNGDAVKLATSVGILLKELKLRSIQKTTNPLPKNFRPTGHLDPKKMEQLLWAGTWKNDVYRVSRGRGVWLKNRILGNSEGVNNWIEFAGDEKHAIVTGKIGSIKFELKETILALTQKGIQITSIGTELLEATPTTIFVSFWGTGNVSDLAAAITDAVAVTENHQSN